MTVASFPCWIIRVVDRSKEIAFLSLFPTSDFLGLLVCYKGINSELESVEKAFVAIC